MSDIDNFPDGTFVALILPSGKKAVGIVKQFGTEAKVHYVAQDGGYSTVYIEDTLNIAELIINWEASVH